MVTVRVMGGLGNQLFQYAFARAIQLEYGTDIVLDTSFYNKKRPFRFRLENFCLSDSVKVKEEKRILYPTIANMLHNAPSLQKKVLHSFGCIFNENGFQSDLNISKDLVEKKNLYFWGYWQNYDFFSAYDDILRTELRVKDELLVNEKTLINSMKQSDSVCVHIRRGDYVNLGWTICDESYYKKAMAYICEKVSNPVFHVFSDDIEWVKANYDFSSFNVVYMDAERDDFIELAVMYHCRHFIMSNSTFSWWAQYLGDASEKKVVAPSIWMKHAANPNIYLKEWKLMDV